MKYEILTMKFKKKKLENIGISSFFGFYNKKVKKNLKKQLTKIDKGGIIKKYRLEKINILLNQ